MTNDHPWRRRIHRGLLKKWREANPERNAEARWRDDANRKEREPQPGERRLSDVLKADAEVNGWTYQHAYARVMAMVRAGQASVRKPNPRLVFVRFYVDPDGAVGLKSPAASNRLETA